MDNFKYPVVRLFFDGGGVACTFVEDMVKLRPELKEQFEDKSWEITRLEPVEEDFFVMAVADAQDIIDEADGVDDEIEDNG